MFHFSRGWPYGSFNLPEYSCNSGYISLKQKTRKEKKKEKSRAMKYPDLSICPRGDTIPGSRSPLLMCTSNKPNSPSRSGRSEAQQIRR